MHKKTLGAAAALALLVMSPVHAQVKWHPGHYARLAGGASVSQNLKTIARYGDEAALKGYMVMIPWGQIEKSKGVYDTSMIDAYLKKLRAQPTRKQLIVRIMERCFCSSPGQIVPSYLRKESIYHGGIVRTSQGYAARLWEKPVMDRLITLYKVIGKRYDGDVHFEGLSTGETTLSLKKPFPSGYSKTALTTQWKRLAANAKPSMPHTNLWVVGNFIGSSNLMSQLIQSFVSIDVGEGSSNTIPNRMSLGQQVWTGYYGADYRGMLPLLNSVETKELKQFSPSTINNYAYKTLRVNHLIWIMDEWSGNSATSWSKRVLPYIRTRPAIRTACPSVYGSCSSK